MQTFEEKKQIKGLKIKKMTTFEKNKEESSHNKTVGHVIWVKPGYLLRICKLIILFDLK